MIERDRWHQCRAERFRDRRVDHEDIDHVREESEGQKLEDPIDLLVAREDLYGEQSQSDRDHEPGDRRPHDDPGGVGDSAQVGPDVHDVRDEHERDRGIEDPTRVVLLEDAGEPGA